MKSIKKWVRKILEGKELRDLIAKKEKCKSCSWLEDGVCLSKNEIILIQQDEESECDQFILKKELAEKDLKIWLIEQYPQYCNKDDNLDTVLGKIKDHVSEADIIKRMIETTGMYEQHLKEAAAFIEGAKWWMNYSGAKVSPLTFEDNAKEEALKRYKGGN